MPYRVIIAQPSADAPAGTYVRSWRPTFNVLPDGFTFSEASEAEEYRQYMAERFPSVDYRVVNNYFSTDRGWDTISESFAAIYGNSAPTDRDEDEDEGDEEDECRICLEEGHSTDDHCEFYCENCGWTCGVHECEECLRWHDWGEMNLCSYCYEEEGSAEGSVGLSIVTCTACGTLDVHHDDIAEEFVCDHIARDLLANGGMVTLAHPIDTDTRTLEAV